MISGSLPRLRLIYPQYMFKVGFVALAARLLLKLMGASRPNPHMLFYCSPYVCLALLNK